MLPKVVSWGGRVVLLIIVMLLAGQAPLLSQEETTPAEPCETTAEAAPPKLIKMFAENWKWHPSTIRVAAGTQVTIEVENVDSPHIFLMKDYDLKVSLPEGKTTTFVFVADKVGTFKWRCGRPCGNGCPKMTGKLIVE